VYFPQASHGNALAQASSLALATAAKEKGYTKSASITCVEVQVCRDAYAAGPKLAAKYGMQLVYRAQASLGQPDFTAECLNARNAGAQVISIGMDANATRAIAQSCARQGYKPMFSFTTGIVIAAHAQDPNLAGALISSVVAPWTVGDTPGRKEFQDAMARFAAGSGLAGGHMLGWVAGKLFELGGRDLPEPATPKALLDGLGRIHGDVLADLTAPLLFSPGKPAQPSVCAFAVTITGGKFVPALGGRRVCDTYDPSLF
jgi:branched-chain amino acid transport system substrate-binding protein